MKKFWPVHRFVRRIRFTRFAKFEGNKFIYFWIASKKEEGYEKGTNNFSSFACFHTFLYSQSLRSLYVYSILLLFFTPFIRQSIVDDDGNDDVATLPSLFRNSWTSTFIRWSKFPACILLWLKFADFYAVLKCILMLHVGRMAEEYKDELEKDFEESLSPSLSSKQYILEIFILISFRRTYRISKY